MRHQLMDPAFPDIVGELAARQLEAACGSFLSIPRACNDDDSDDHHLADAFMQLLGRLEIAATRLW
jgi:hypothetical protein